MWRPKKQEVKYLSVFLHTESTKSNENWLVSIDYHRVECWKWKIKIPLIRCRRQNHLFFQFSTMMSSSKSISILERWNSSSAGTEHSFIVDHSCSWLLNRFFQLFDDKLSKSQQPEFTKSVTTVVVIRTCFGQNLLLR